MVFFARSGEILAEDRELFVYFSTAKDLTGGSLGRASSAGASQHYHEKRSVDENWGSAKTPFVTMSFAERILTIPAADK